MFVFCKGQRNKKSMDSELARGRVNKCYWWVAIRSRASGLYVLLYELQFFLVDLLFTLRIVRLNPPHVFYLFGFPGLSYCCVFYFPLLYIDMIYLC